jgi:hypothetical protein
MKAFAFSAGKFDQFELPAVFYCQIYNLKTQNPAEAGPYVDILFWIVLTAKSKFD